MMNILFVTEDDFDAYGDWLIGDAANSFVAGGYTHINYKGEIMQCEQHPADDGKILVMICEQEEKQNGNNRNTNRKV